MLKRNALWFVLCLCLSLATGITGKATAQVVNPVIQWNRFLLTIVRTPGAQPATVHPTRSFAILHASIYDAVNTIDQTHTQYLVQLSGVSHTASQDAAADAAAHEVLVNLYPTFQANLDSEFNQALAQIPDGQDKTDGIAIGQRVADQFLAFRKNDGSSDTPSVFVPINVPGTYQLTPPNFKPAQFTHWSKVTPFAIESSSQFRPGPPPALTSDIYEDAFNEIKAVGMLNSTVATPEQKLIGLFWNGAIQNYWNEIAQTLAIEHKLTTAETAREFALLNITVADTVIAFYDAKYTYKFWRPVTAVREADGQQSRDECGSELATAEHEYGAGPVVSRRARGDQPCRGVRSDLLLPHERVPPAGDLRNLTWCGEVVCDDSRHRRGGDTESRACGAAFPVRRERRRRTRHTLGRLRAGTLSDAARGRRERRTRRLEFGEARRIGYNSAGIEFVAREGSVQKTTAGVALPILRRLSVYGFSISSKIQTSPHLDCCGQPDRSVRQEVVLRSSGWSETGQG